jgi:hypothetical protein
MEMAVQLNTEHRCIHFDKTDAQSEKRFDRIGIVLVVCLDVVCSDKVAVALAFGSVLAPFFKVMLEPSGSETVVS